MIQIDGEIYHVHGLEESILSKWLYYPKQSIDYFCTSIDVHRNFSLFIEVRNLSRYEGQLRNVN